MRRRREKEHLNPANSTVMHTRSNSEECLRKKFKSRCNSENCVSEKLLSVDEVQVDRITISFSFLNRDTF